MRGKIFTIVVTRVDSALNHNVPALGEVANFGTDYFLLKINFLRKVNVNLLQNSQSCQTLVIGII
ncbi:hypothetical protein [Flavobacterium psychrophilum]|uniref:hypothetical protein n=1 Tax=Flavobacterium psychrophilum TaxID=96345 RepID=UPI0011EA6E61|nr:hypothetical protein [Flavobacterium psychrophilum]